MPTESPSIRIEFRNEYAYIVLFFLLAAVFLFSNLWIGDMGLDSCAYATISRSILRTHDWLVPHYEHCPQFQDCWLHPPLFYWMTAVSFKVFGINEFAARFFPALLGLGTILLVYLIGWGTGRSHKAGFLSAFVLLTTQPFLELSRKCQIDVPLAFFLTLTVFFFRLAVQKSKYFFIPAGIAAGLATLTKGLPALGILGVIGLFFAIKGDFKFFISGRLLMLMTSYILTLGLWLGPLLLAGQFQNFVHNYFGGQIWGILTGEAASQKGLFAGSLGDYLWYIVALIKRYWPWLPFLIFSFYLGLKRRKETPFGFLFLLWILVFLLFFSVSTLKFYRYLAPLYPAFALLIGVMLADKIRDKAFRSLVNASLAILFIVLLATSLFPLYFGKINAPDKTEIKKMAPYIRSLARNAEPISIYKLNYWGTVADFAFYVDRPVRNYDTDETFLRSLQAGEHYGYLKKADYLALPQEIQAQFLPLFETKNFFLITNLENCKSQLKRAFPFVIY
jgi:4-amino-4-deoxy-L-arabinose transferase-like glycosyltransferase